MIRCFLIIIGILIAIFALIFIYVACINDDVEEIDNIDGHIICGNTGKSCIKDKLYAKCNNCNECPYSDEQ